MLYRRNSVRHRFMIGASASAMVILSGCSSGIQASHIQEGKPIPPGNPWNLAMTQFTITINRHVVGCGEKFIPKVDILAVPGPVLDESQRYILSSNGWWATSDITSNLAPDGTSTGLNAQSTDQTATIISNIVGSIAQAAIANAAIPAAAVAPKLSHGPLADICTSEISNAVNALYPPKDKNGKPKTISLKQVVDNKTAELTSATERVSLLTVQVGLDKTTYAKPLAEALAVQAALQTQVNSAQRALTEALSVTTDTQVVRWPMRSNRLEDYRSGAYSIDDQVLDKWVSSTDKAEKTRSEIKKSFDVKFALYTPDPATSAWTVPTPPAPNPGGAGVPYRLAQLGRLLACAGKECPEGPVSMTTQESDEAISSFDQIVLQLSPTYLLDVEGGSFKAHSVSITMASGVPVTIEVAEKQSAGVALTTTTKDVFTQAAALPAQIVQQQTALITALTNQATAAAQLQAAQASLGVAGGIASNNAQAALQSAANSLATAKSAAAAQATSDVNAATARLNAQISLANAIASAKVAPEVGVLSAEASLINAQAATINAQAAQIKALASLPKP